MHSTNFLGLKRFECWDFGKLYVGTVGFTEIMQSIELENCIFGWVILSQGQLGVSI